MGDADDSRWTPYLEVTSSSKHECNTLALRQVDNRHVLQTLGKEDLLGPYYKDPSGGSMDYEEEHHRVPTVME